MRSTCSKVWEHNYACFVIYRCVAIIRCYFYRILMRKVFTLHTFNFNRNRHHLHWNSNEKKKKKTKEKMPFRRDLEFWKLTETLSLNIFKRQENGMIRNFWKGENLLERCVGNGKDEREFRNLTLKVTKEKREYEFAGYWRKFRKERKFQMSFLNMQSVTSFSEISNWSSIEEYQ